MLRIGEGECGHVMAKATKLDQFATRFPWYGIVVET